MLSERATYPVNVDMTSSSVFGFGIAPEYIICDGLVPKQWSTKNKSAGTTGQTSPKQDSSTCCPTMTSSIHLSAPPPQPDGNWKLKWKDWDFKEGRRSEA